MLEVGAVLLLDPLVGHHSLLQGLGFVIISESGYFHKDGHHPFLQGVGLLIVSESGYCNRDGHQLLLQGLW